MGDHHHPTAADFGQPGDARYREIRKVTLVGSAIDLTLGVLKLIFGYLASSQALLADGVHSLSDLATDFMVLWAAKHGSKEADEDHPYGHGRIETLATVALGIALMIVAAGIAWDAIERLFNPTELLRPGVWALLVAALSVVSKEWTYHYTMRLARRLRSDMLKANAWHSRSDAISSVVVVIGVAGTMAGLDYLDSVAAVVVALMVAKIGWDLSWESLHELTDAALESERVEAIRKAILEVDGVHELHMLRTRRMGGEALVDVHILVDPKLSVSEGHYLSEKVRRRVVDTIEEVSDVLVHIDPEDDEKMAPSMNLPPRSAIIGRLHSAWQNISGVEQISRITLHYLNGRLHVEVYLPIEIADPTTRAQALAERLTQAAAGIEDVETVKVFYG